MSSGHPLIEAVTFDLDGTLYDHAEVRLPLLLRNLLRLRVLRVGKQVREELRSQVFASGELLLAEEARIAGERLDVAPTRARALLDAAFERSLSSVLRRRRHAGTREALARLAGRVKIAVVSDRRIDDKLAALALDALPWAAKVSADDTGVLKPSPQPFLLACARMGVAPRCAAHVGDRDEMDGAGARAAGLAFHLVSGPVALPGLVDRLLGQASLDEQPPGSP